MIRDILAAGLIVLALSIAPAFAADDDAGQNGPVALTNSSSDNSTQTLDQGSQPSDAAVAMDAANAGSNDPLPNFGPSSGTVVGNRAMELRDEFLRLRASVNLNTNEFTVLRSSGAAGAVQYHSTVAAITARLQNGTTRGNPILLRQWNEANSSLDQVTSSLNRLNALEMSIDADASVASYLLDSVQAAYQLSGAVDEDHDQLKILSDEVSRQIVQLEYLRNQTTDDIQRQTSYLSTERANLQTLAFAISRGELLGSSLANRPLIVNTTPVMSIPQPSAAAAPAAAPAACATMPTAAACAAPAPAPMPQAFAPQAAPAAPVASAAPAAAPPPDTDSAPVPALADISTGVAPSVGQLLVLIRYNQPNVEYDQQLSQAVGAAIERRPDAQFSVIAVSPSSGDPTDLAKQQQTAQSNAEAVKRSLVELGLQPSRITMSSTQMQSAQTPEVHVYIR